MLVVLGLVAALVVIRDERDKAEAKLKDAEKQIQQLQDQNKQLKIEGINETRKTETVVQQPARPEPVNRVLSVSGSCEQYRGLVSQYSWNIDIAMAVMRAESTQYNIPCNKDAKSPTDDHGLFQINHGYDIYGSIIYDPAFNIKIAYTEKYAKGGWSHWSVCNNGTVKCW